jgi:F-type H+-transporting ATPase subunit b
MGRRSICSRCVSLAVTFALGLVLWVSTATADNQHALAAQDTHGGPVNPHVTGAGEGHGAPARGAPLGAAPAHGEAPAHPEAAHGTPGHGEHSEGGHAEHDEKAPPQEINWWHGVLGPKEGVEPGFLFRRPDEPPPFLASIFNFAVLVFAFVYFGRKPLADALVKRKEDITREMTEAQRLHEQAQERLAQYEAKLSGLTDELERIKASYREQGLRDKERIIREAKERSEKMHADAAQILEQELKHTRQLLLAETVEQATRLATQLIAEHGTPSDHDRFAENFLRQLGARDRTDVVKGGMS